MARYKAEKARLEAQEKANEDGRKVLEGFQTPSETKLEAAPVLSVEGVYYICPISGEVVKKSEYVEHLEQQLELIKESAPMETSVFKLHCLNTNRGNLNAKI